MDNQVFVADAQDLVEFFAQPDESDLWAVLFKKASGKQTVTYEELLDVAIAWGWIDTQVRRVDDERYALRFRRRKPGGNWTPANLEIARKLVAAGVMTDPGRATLPDNFDPAR